MSTSVRVMTWNVHGTFSLNPKFDLPAVIALIRKWSPDIVALQEIDSRGGGSNQFTMLSDALGGHSVGAKSIISADGDYGQMLISRFPWSVEPAIHDISYLEREPRRAIAADVMTGAGELRVISTHLGLGIGERRQQAQKLLAIAEVAGPTLIMGDFNDWFWMNSVRGSLAARFPVRTRYKTFPARFPMMRLDRVYGSGIRIVKSYTDPAARRVSDHLPVIADIAVA
jgi:endonuclease/exonuclease/phosphatase family metal-dependent hydrolase